MNNDGGYKIYLKDDEDNIFYFNKTLNKSFTETSENINVSKTVLNTFGTYPYVYKAGNMNYKTLDLSGIFIEKDGMSAKYYLDLFKSKVNQNKPFIMVNPLGDNILVDITIKSISNPLLYQEKAMEYITINISCIEIGSV